MSTPDPSNHHYVPRYYLRTFGVPDKPNAKPAWVSAYDRRFGSIRKKAIKSIASERDFYTLDVPSGQDPYILEKKFFGNVDTLGSQLISSILTKREIVPEQKPRLREHLAVQVVRTKWFRDYVREQAPKAWQTQEAMKMAAAGPPDYFTESQKQVYRDLVEKMPTEGWSILQDPNVVTMLPIGRYYTFRDGLEQFSDYRLAWIPYSGFLTSDNPILLRHARSGLLGSPMNIGLNEASELWYPLSPQFALRMAKEHAGWETTLLPKIPEVLELNTAVAKISQRWTIWNPDSVAKEFVELPPKNAL